MKAVSAKLQGLATWLKKKGFDRESLAIVRLASHEKELIEQYPQFTKERLNSQKLNQPFDYPAQRYP